MKILQFLLIGLVFTACSAPRTPEAFSVEGIRVSACAEKESILRVTERDNSLLLLTWDGCSTNQITLRPWKSGLFNIQGPELYVQIRLIVHPQGAVRELTFYQAEYRKLQIVSGAKRFHSVLPGWSLLPGPRLDIQVPGKGEWCGVVLTGPESLSYTQLPGESRRLGGPEFILLSSFFQEETTPQIADDILDFRADYLLVWSRE